MGKVCTKCKKEKPLSQFYSGKGKDGKRSDCKVCVLAYRKIQYRTSIHYYLNMRYHTMLQRAEGRSTYPTGAKGLPILTQREFFQWYESTKTTFDKLYKAYKEADYDLSLAPSVDRVDNEKGYELGNLQWLTQHDNASKGNRNTFDYGSYHASD